jgi:hypothetical protein
VIDGLIGDDEVVREVERVRRLETAHDLVSRWNLGCSAALPLKSLFQVQLYGHLRVKYQVLHCCFAPVQVMARDVSLFTAGVDGAQTTTVLNRVSFAVKRSKRA